MTSNSTRGSLARSLAQSMFLAGMISVATSLLAWRPSVGACTDDAQFVVDMSQPEKAQNIPGNIITKVWRVRNSGTCLWTTGYKLTMVGGSLPMKPKSVPLPAQLEPERSIDLSASFVVPSQAGEYTGQWRLQSPSGEFFGPLLSVNVVAIEPELDGALPQVLALGGMGGGGGGPCDEGANTAGGAPTLRVLKVNSADRVVCFDNFPGGDALKIWLEDPIGNVYYDEPEGFSMNGGIDIYLQAPAARGEWRVTASAGGATHSTTFQVSDADFARASGGSRFLDILGDSPLYDPTVKRVGETLTLHGVGFPPNGVLPIGIYNDDDTLRFATTVQSDSVGEIILKLPVLANWLIGGFRQDVYWGLSYTLYVLPEMENTYHDYSPIDLPGDSSGVNFRVEEGEPHGLVSAPSIPNRGGPVSSSGNEPSGNVSSGNWVDIPAGDFTMGSDDANLQRTLDECNSTEGNCERAWFASESPVRLASTAAYAMMQREVTNGQYSRCVAAGGCATARKLFRNNADAESAGYFDPEYPVTGVTWRDAADYCAWVGGRLPTEIEWEKAARGTDGRRYPWGNSWQPGNANLYTFQLSPAGSYPAGSSPFGIDDMAGNVVEWTATIDQKGRAILRGGGFESNYFRGRTTDRGTKLEPDFANFDIGFRCVR